VLHWQINVKALTHPHTAGEQATEKM